MITQKKAYDTGVMGMNFGRHDEQRRKLAEERKQEYNRMMAQKVERERRYSVVSKQVVNKKDPPPLPKRPPSSIAAFGQPSSFSSGNFGASRDILPTNNFGSSTFGQPASLSNEFDFGKQDLEGALNQLTNFMSPSTTADLNFSPPRFSNSADAALTTYEPPPLQSVLHQPLPPPRQPSFSAPDRNRSHVLSSTGQGLELNGFPDKRRQQQQYRQDLDQQAMEQRNRNYASRRNPASTGSTYQPSIYEDTSRRRGQYDGASGVPLGNQNTYKAELEQQIMERQLRSQKEAESSIKYELKKHKEIEEYNPWGKGGAGAPNKDASGNIISSRAYRHAGHQQVNPGNAPGGDFRDDLRKQILDNKLRAEENERSRRLEDEKLAKRSEEQAARMKSEYEAEQAKHKRKEEELQKKQEMMRNIQEQQMKEDMKRRKELEEKRRIGRERLEEDDPQTSRYQDENRVKSPIIPTLRDRGSGSGEQSQQDYGKQVPDNYSSSHTPNADRKRNDPDNQQEALNTLSTVRQHLQARQQELQKDIENQRKKFQGNLRNRSENVGDEDITPEPRGSFLKSAARIRSTINDDSRMTRGSNEIRHKNKARIRKLNRLQRETSAMDGYRNADDFLDDYGD